jgi:hypothetical protein
MAGKADVLDTLEGRKAVQAMATYLGIDPSNEKQLMWIAERALLAPLPRNWEEISTPDGKVSFLNAAGVGALTLPLQQTCYMHSVSKVTAWQHPRDDYFKSLVGRNRERARFIEAVLRNNSMYRFDEGNCSKEVAITDEGRRATCLQSLVYPSFRLRDPFFTAVRCVQLRVESLPDLGFISFGFGPSNFHKNEDCIPDDAANYFAYTSVGETYAMGSLVRKNGVRISSGDSVLMVINFPLKRIVWYRNAHPVAWLDAFSLREAYAAFVFGAKTYSISVTECIRLPHELMRWCKVSKAASVELLDDDFAARSCAASGYTAVRAAHAYSDGVPYFECQVVNLAKDGYVLIGLGGPDMGECNTHIPDECYDHYGVASSGEACDRPLIIRSLSPALTRLQLRARAAGQRKSTSIWRGRPRGLHDQLCSKSGIAALRSLCFVILQITAPLTAPSGYVLFKRQARGGVQRPARTRGFLGERGVWSSRLSREHQPRATAAVGRHTLERRRAAAVQVAMMRP